MRIAALVLDMVAGALVVTGAWLLTPWLALMLAGVLCALLALVLDPPSRR